jgi:hypothetical protein
VLVANLPKPRRASSTARSGPDRASAQKDYSFLFALTDHRQATDKPPENPVMGGVVVYRRRAWMDF